MGRLTGGRGTRNLARRRGTRRFILEHRCVSSFGRDLISRLRGACVMDPSNAGGGMATGSRGVDG